MVPAVKLRSARLSGPSPLHLVAATFVWLAAALGLATAFGSGAPLAASATPVGATLRLEAPARGNPATRLEAPSAGSVEAPEPSQLDLDHERSKCALCFSSAPQLRGSATPKGVSSSPVGGPLAASPSLPRAPPHAT